MVHASITRLGGPLAELEGQPALSLADRLTAKQLLAKLEGLDAEYRAYYLAVMDLAEDGALEAEQAMLDEHDDRVIDMTTCLQQLVVVLPGAAPTEETEAGSRQLLHKRLCHVEKNLQPMADAVKAIEPDSEIDSYFLRQHEERLSDLKQGRAARHDPWDSVT